MAVRNKNLLSPAVAAACLAWLAAVAPAGAQLAQPDPEARAAFLEMYADPTNLDKTFRYAELAARAGDFEGAISALERMLMFNPDLPRVRLELGVLYFRLGSFETARVYFQQVMTAPDAPSEVRERVTAFLGEIERQTSPHLVSGTVAAGVRLQSNANAGPGSPIVRLLGGSARLTDEFTQKSDANLFAAATLDHAYDFQAEPDVLFETSLNLFGSRQFDLSDLDTRVADLRTGPRITLNPAFLPDTRIRPFFSTGFVGLGGHPYFYSYGGGVEAGTSLSSWATLELEAQHRERDYRAGPDTPDAVMRDGYVQDVTATLRLAPHDGGAVTLEASVGRETARQPWLQNRELGISLGYMFGYAAPLGGTGAPWMSGITAALSNTRYDRPNRIIDPSVTREDREHRLNIMNIMPLTDSLALTVNLQRTVIRSNLPNYTNDDSQMSISGMWRF